MSDDVLAAKIQEAAQRLRAITEERDALIWEAGRRRRAGHTGWTQKEIADLADMSQPAVCKKLAKQPERPEGTA